MKDVYFYLINYTVKGDLLKPNQVFVMIEFESTLGTIIQLHFDINCKINAYLNSIEYQQVDIDGSFYKMTTFEEIITKYNEFKECKDDNR